MSTRYIINNSDGLLPNQTINGNLNITGGTLYIDGNSVVVNTGGSVTPFLNATGIDPNSQEGIAVTNLYNNLVNTGAIDEFIAIYPILGDNAFTHSFNLLNPDKFQLNYEQAFQHSANGMYGDPNTITGYANTGIIPGKEGMQVDDWGVIYCLQPRPDQNYEATGAEVVNVFNNDINYTGFPFKCRAFYDIDAGLIYSYTTADYYNFGILTTAQVVQGLSVNLGGRTIHKHGTNGIFEFNTLLVDINQSSSNVSATSDPFVSYYWSKRGTPIYIGDSYTNTTTQFIQFIAIGKSGILNLNINPIIDSYQNELGR